MKTIHPLLQHLQFPRKTLVEAFSERTMNQSECSETIQILEENYAYWEKEIARLEKEIKEQRAIIEKEQNMNPYF